MALVLIVDDEALMRVTLARMLTAVGHECVPAASANQARAIMNARPIDRMMTDITMPGESGPTRDRLPAQRAAPGGRGRCEDP